MLFVFPALIFLQSLLSLDLSISLLPLHPPFFLVELYIYKSLASVFCTSHWGRLLESSRNVCFKKKAASESQKLHRLTICLATQNFFVQWRRSTVQKQCRGVADLLRTIGGLPSSTNTLPSITAAVATGLFQPTWKWGLWSKRLEGCRLQNVPVWPSCQPKLATATKSSVEFKKAYQFSWSSEEN